MTDKKSKRIVLLKDKLDYKFKTFGSNFNSIGKKVLKKLANDEKKIVDLFIGHAKRIFQKIK